MIGFPLQSILPPHMFARVIAMRAMVSIWEEFEQKGWKDAADREFCAAAMKKRWNEYTDKEVQMIEMLALKYGDQPSPYDVSPDRVIH